MTSIMGMISTRAFRFFGSSQLRIALPRCKSCGDSGIGAKLRPWRSPALANRYNFYNCAAE
ncbi:hypothetical protein CPter91_5079 [Collimonas pratensis]|uniref:Uncharacterized protein n=1 Tax=Collimonas pratensis TaxID=279113 RepID=A0A127QBE4_9BURK|nr:hypothetical protein CPter91_5079 [Collimonas pratensis]